MLTEKRYSSPSVQFTVNVKVDGKQTPLVFNQYSGDYKRRFVIVTDPDIQKQLEKSPDFNVYFHLDYTREINEEPKEESFEEQDNIQEPVNDQPNIAALTPKNFEKTIDAKKWLNELGIPYNRIATKDKMFEEAKRLGFELTIE
jgi:hypothetical protein